MDYISDIQYIARWLLAHEAAARIPSETKTPPAMRVCEKLRRPLSTLAGAAGYVALVSRALALAKAEAPSLALMEVKEDGVLAWPDTDDGMDKTADGSALVARLLGLLDTFIGEALTMQLVREIWPDAPFEGVDSKREKS